MGRGGKDSNSLKRTWCSGSDKGQRWRTGFQNIRACLLPHPSLQGKAPGAQRPGGTSPVLTQPALGWSGLLSTRVRPQRGFSPRSARYLTKGFQTWCGTALAQGDYNPHGQTRDEATLEPHWRKKIKSSGQCTMISQWSALSPDGFRLNPCKISIFPLMQQLLLSTGLKSVLWREGSPFPETLISDWCLFSKLPGSF